MERLPILHDMLDNFDSNMDPLMIYDGFGFGRNSRRHRPSLAGSSDLVNFVKELDELRQLAFQRNHQRQYQACQIGKDGFQACMDVSQFKPNELIVKVVGNSVVVEGKHEEREDRHGHISRHFMRRYTLPKGYDPNSVISTLSSDGVLTVSAPKPQLENKQEERMIAIHQTGPAHLNVKENEQEKVGDSNAEAKAKK